MYKVLYTGCLDTLAPPEAKTMGGTIGIFDIYSINIVSCSTFCKFPGSKNHPLLIYSYLYIQGVLKSMPKSMPKNNNKNS